MGGGGGDSIKTNKKNPSTHESRKAATMTRTGKSGGTVKFDGFDGFIGLSGKPKQVVPVEFVDVAAVTAARVDGNYAKKFISKF